MKNPYKILGISESASNEEIKKAYRTLAMKYHPDKGGDELKFKEIAEAYDILTDPKKLQKWKSANIFDQFQSEDQFFNDFMKSQGFSDMFNNRYGWSQNGKGANIQSELSLSLSEGYFGTKRELRLGLKNISVNIKPGIKHGQKLRLKGLGQKGLTDELNGDLILTIFIVNDNNIVLNGKDLHIAHNINMFDAILGGKSMVELFNKKISFTIPKGTQNGSILRIVEKGYPVYERENKYGDLYINVSVDLPNDLSESELEMISQIKNSIDERKR